MALGDISITMTREDLLAELERRLSLVQTRDKTITDKHKQEEKDNLARWKKDCREWNAAQQKLTIEGFKRQKYGPQSPRFNKATCPTAWTPIVKRMIAEIKLGSQKSYKVSPNGYSYLYDILTMELPRVKDVC